MADDLVPAPPEGQLLIYQDGALRLQVRIDGKTVWLTQRLIAELYPVSVKTVSEHLVNIYKEDEPDSAATIRRFRIVQPEGSPPFATPHPLIRKSPISEWLVLPPRLTVNAQADASGPRAFSARTCHAHMSTPWTCPSGCFRSPAGNEHEKHRSPSVGNAAIITELHRQTVHDTRLDQKTWANQERIDYGE